MIKRGLLPFAGASVEWETYRRQAASCRIGQMEGFTHIVQTERQEWVKSNVNKARGVVFIER